MDPGWGEPVPDAGDPIDGDRSARPTDPLRPLTGLLAAGWQRTDDLQHDRTRIVDLDDPDRLWADVRSRTQRYVKSARKAGITITREGAESSDEFHGLLVATAERAGFFPRDADSYRRIVDTFGPDGSHLLMARTAAGRAVAGLLIVRCGDTVAEPSGGMDDEGAETRANYLLKWEAIAPGGGRWRPPLRHVGHRARRHRPVQVGLRRPRGALPGHLRPPDDAAPPTGPARRASGVGRHRSAPPRPRAGADHPADEPPQPAPRTRRRCTTDGHAPDRRRGAARRGRGAAGGRHPGHQLRRHRAGADEAGRGGAAALGAARPARGRGRRPARRARHTPTWWSRPADSGRPPTT